MKLSAYHEASKAIDARFHAKLQSLDEKTEERVKGMLSERWQEMFALLRRYIEESPNEVHP